MTTGNHSAKPIIHISSTPRRGFGCLVAVFLLPILYYGLYFAQRGSLPIKQSVIAHRGGPVIGPENTLATFRRAIETGVDWLEMDVQRSSDGVLVVIHDETVDRTTNGTGQVADLTLADLKALDAGDGEPIPTFEEALKLAKDAGVGILPEAKSPHLYPGIETQMAEAIMAEDYLENTVVQSFDHESLATIQEINPQINVCPLYGLWRLDINDPKTNQASKLCPMAEMVILNPWMVRQAHAEGHQVFIWFGAIEHPITMRLLLVFGADGLMVDDPIALQKILD